MNSKITQQHRSRPAYIYVRQSTVRQVVGSLTDEQLAGSTTPVPGPGWPPPQSFPVRDVLGTILDEEWWHRQFAERDLAALRS